ncbi:hypothetical protein [Chromobacterium sp. ATCC 53434]|uniref:hypothetical protein n=1 Tax=Chromobacterium sp. (strain ATCC 53434 / SC 14030) TaxID=2059672 RepID=UPI0018F201D3|nr:hypothetical protein [Chromobacterium sp. ATCC 53434]
MATLSRRSILKAFAAFQDARKYCIQEFAKLGVRIYTPTQQEHTALATAFGPANHAWAPVKTALLGPNGMAIFDELYKAAIG